MWQQVLVAVGFPCLWVALLYASLYIRGVKFEKVLSAFIRTQAGEHGVKPAYKNIVTNTAVSSALFLSIQFSGLFSLLMDGDTDSVLKMVVMATMANSILSALFSFISSLHLLLMMAMVQEKAALQWLDFKVSALGSGPTNGLQLLLLVILCVDQSLIWLLISCAFWIFDRTAYPVAMGLFWISGSCAAIWCSEASYAMFFKFFDIKHSPAAAVRRGAALTTAVSGTLLVAPGTGKSCRERFCDETVQPCMVHGVRDLTQLRGRNSFDSLRMRTCCSQVQAFQD